MAMRSITAVALLVVLIAAMALEGPSGNAYSGVWGTGHPGPAAFPGTNGKISFSSDRDGNREIYVMDAAGTNQTNLTNSAAQDYEPAWSPDGSKIAFRSDRDGNGEIYVMDAADGTGGCAQPDG